MVAIEIFTRKEQKYLITKEQYEALIQRLTGKMRPDRNGENGRYTVTSLYFDNADQRIYFETKNTVRSREKPRLGVYDQSGLNDSACFEVKQRPKKVVNQRRMVLPLREAYRYFKDDAEPLHTFETSNARVFREIDHF